MTGRISMCLGERVGAWDSISMCAAWGVGSGGGGARSSISMCLGGAQGVSLPLWLWDAAACQLWRVSNEAAEDTRARFLVEGPYCLSEICMGRGGEGGVGGGSLECPCGATVKTLSQLAGIAMACPWVRPPFLCPRFLAISINGVSALHFSSFSRLLQQRKPWLILSRTSNNANTVYCTNLFHRTYYNTKFNFYFICESSQPEGDAKYS